MRAFSWLDLTTLRHWAPRWGCEKEQMVDLKQEQEQEQMALVAVGAEEMRPDLVLTWEPGRLRNLDAQGGLWTKHVLLSQSGRKPLVCWWQTWAYKKTGQIRSALHTEWGVLGTPGASQRQQICSGQGHCPHNCHKRLCSHRPWKGDGGSFCLLG